MSGGIGGSRLIKSMQDRQETSKWGPIAGPSTRRGRTSGPGPAQRDSTVGPRQVVPEQRCLGGSGEGRRGARRESAGARRDRES